MNIFRAFVLFFLPSCVIRLISKIIRSKKIVSTKRSTFSLSVDETKIRQHIDDLPDCTGLHRTTPDYAGLKRITPNYTEICGNM